MENLAALLEDMRKTASGRDRPQPSTSPVQKPRRHGLIDLLAVAMAFYAMMVTTPAGGILLRAFNHLTGSRARTRPLIAYFETGSTHRKSTRPVVLAPGVKSTDTDRVAKKAGLQTEVARAVAMVAAGGAQDARGHYQVTLGPEGQDAFRAVGVTFPSQESAKMREEALLLGVGRLKEELKSDEAAVAATAIEIAHVRYALERARAGGASDPIKYEDFRRFLPPGDRGDADNIVHGTFALSTAYGLTWPVEERYRVSSPFGYRRHPVLGRRRFHRGTDLSVPTGTDVRSIADGIVLYATRDGVNGLFVKIDHGYGLTSAYSHNSELLVRRGARVEKGELIARSGSTGRSTGPHLHFQLEIEGRAVDPELFRQGAPPLARISPWPSLRMVQRAVMKKARRWLQRQKGTFRTFSGWKI